MIYVVCVCSLLYVSVYLRFARCVFRVSIDFNIHDHLFKYQNIHLYAYYRTHSLAYMTLFLFHLHLYSLYSRVRVLAHLYAATSLLTYTYVCHQIYIHIFIHISEVFMGTWSSTFICIYVHIPMYSCSNYHGLATFNIDVLVLRSIPYSKTPFSISICIYVTVPIQVHIVLIIWLFWSSICMFISPIQTYVY